jgi:sirohydrochlorin ferrochelatase
VIPHIDLRASEFQPILVAHGTRSASGVNTVARLAEQVQAHIGPTRVAFVDVLGPSPAEVLRQDERPALVVPVFLASGYHVRTDIARHVHASAHRQVTVCENVGPDLVLAEVMHHRLWQAGWRPDDAVVMAAAGSCDPAALVDIATAAAHLADILHDDVPVGYVDAVRRSRGGRVFVASYLFAPGLFHARLGRCGADGVAAPLGADPRIAWLLAHRVRAALGDRTRRLSTR